MKLESKLGQFSQEGGFTLIEMLIVVAIIAILVAIAVPALNTAKTDAQAAKYQTLTSAIALAKNRAILGDTTVTGVDPALTCGFSDLQSFMIVNGVVPGAESEILAGTGCSAITWGHYNDTAVVGN